MFNKLRIILFGTQPAAKVNQKTLERIIKRDFDGKEIEVKRKLLKIESETPNEKNRITAAILKLANQNINKIDELIKISNNDYRDVLMRAEYPKCADAEDSIFDNSKMMKGIYLEDWKNYSDWLSKK